MQNAPLQPGRDPAGPAPPDEDLFVSEDRRVAVVAAVALTAIVLVAGVFVSRATQRWVLVHDCAMSRPGVCADLAAR